MKTELPSAACCPGACAPAATGGGLEDSTTRSPPTTTGGPAAYEGQTMNLPYRRQPVPAHPSRNYQLLSAAAPSLRGGGGGIDAFAGASFINVDQFVAMLRNIGQNALGCSS